ncbi:MAG: methyltransferase domain-containing protein [Nocardioides sp.]
MSSVFTDGLPLADAFAEAWRAGACEFVGDDGGRIPLPLDRWTQSADESDREVLGHCLGATLDVGCGPGRMSQHLMDRGHRVLGIDIAWEAVSQARARGVFALQRDVFSPLPAEGRWETVLLADGNLGIGGDPLALLARSAQLLAPGGRVVVDLAEPGHGVRIEWISLSSVSGLSQPFPWAVVGADSLAPLAHEVGFSVAAQHELPGRWFAVLERA